MYRKYLFAIPITIAFLLMAAVVLAQDGTTPQTATQTESDSVTTAAGTTFDYQGGLVQGRISDDDYMASGGVWSIVPVLITPTSPVAPTHTPVLTPTPIVTPTHTPTKMPTITPTKTPTVTPTTPPTPMPLYLPLMMNKKTLSPFTPERGGG